MDELQKYFEYLRQQGADVPANYESFRKTLQDEGSARKYYQYLRDNKFDTPDNYESFSRTFGLGSSKPSDNQNPSPNPNPAPNPISAPNPNVNPAPTEQEPKGLYPNADPSKFETKLSSPERESQFQQWLTKNYKDGKIGKGDYDFYQKNGYGYDYDFRAAFDKGLRPSINPEDHTWHWGDFGKKPNEPTFSDQSKYHGVDGYVGGHWNGDKLSDFVPPANPIDQALQYDQLRNKRVAAPVAADGFGMGTSTQDMPDEGAQKQAGKIKDDLAAQGYDADKIAHIMKDFPEEAYSVKHDDGTMPYSKDHLAQMIKDDPDNAVKYINNTKTLFSLAHSKGGVHAANEFNDLHDHETFDNVIPNVQRQQQIIDENLTGDQHDKAQETLRQNNAPFFNAANTAIQNEYNNSAFKGTLDMNQYAGLKYLQTFDPEQYKQTMLMLNNARKQQSLAAGISNPDALAGAVGGAETPEVKQKIQDQNYNERKGLEMLRQRLSNVGRSNTIAYAQQRMKDIDKEYQTASPDDKEQLKGLYVNYQGMVQNALEDAKLDSQRYPLSTRTQAEDQLKEMTQSAGMSWPEYTLYRAAKTFSKSANSIGDITTSLLGSDRSMAQLNLARLGESNNSDDYLPESLRAESSPYIPKFDKDLEAQVKTILGDKTVPTQQRIDQAVKYIAKNQGKVDWITNPNAGKQKNIFSMATVYNNAGTLGDIFGIATQSLGLGGMGATKLIASGLPMFTTAEDDFRKQALAEGKDNPSEYAYSHALIMAAAGMINPDLSIVKRSIGMNTALGKAIAGIDEGTWNSVVSENKPWLQKFQSSLAAAGKEGLKMAAVYGAGTSIANDLLDKSIFDKPLSVSEITDHAVQASKNIVMQSLGILGMAGISHFRGVPLEQKAHIWQVGANAEDGIEQVKDAVKRGDITPEVGKQREQIIKNVSALIDKVPVEDEKGKPLTDKQRVNYLWNLVVKNKAAELKKDLPESHQAKVEGITAQVDEENKHILQGTKPKLKVVNPDQVYDFRYDSEDDIPKQLSGVKPKGQKEVESTNGKRIQVSYTGKQLIEAGMATEEKGKPFVQMPAVQMEQPETEQPTSGIHVQQPEKGSTAPTEKNGITVQMPKEKPSSGAFVQRPEGRETQSLPGEVPEPPPAEQEQLDEKGQHRELSEPLPEDKKSQAVKVRVFDPEKGEETISEMPAKDAYVGLKKQHAILDKILNCL